MRVVPSALLLVMAMPGLASTRPVHVTGTVANIQSWEIKGYFTSMVVNAVGMPKPGTVWVSPLLMVDLKTGRFEGGIECEVVRDSSGRWVDIHIVGMSHVFGEDPEMIIRTPYARTIELGTFTWCPTRYRLKEEGLALDRGLPRDTVLGDLSGDHIRMSPINPTEADSVQLEFVWVSSGAPFVADRSVLHKRDRTLVEFSFAVRADVDVCTDSWPQHARPIVLPRLLARQYELRQVPAVGEHLRDVNFLHGRSVRFTVGDRQVP